jgi:hypothetical protein
LALLPKLGDGSHCEEGSWGPTLIGSTNDSPSEKDVQKLVDRAREREKPPPSTVSPNKNTDQVMSGLGADFSSFGDVMLQVGINHHARVFEPPHFMSTQDLKSDPHKTQFLGRSHWMNTFNMVCSYVHPQQGSFNQHRSPKNADTRIKMARL